MCTQIMYCVYTTVTYTAGADEQKKQVTKHCSDKHCISPKDFDIQTVFFLKNSRNKFDWLVHEVLKFG